MKNIIILVEKDSINGFSSAWVMYYYYFLQNDKNIKYSLKYIFVDPLKTNNAIKEFREYNEKIGCYKAYSFGIYYLKEDLVEIKSIFPNIVINVSKFSIAWKYMYPDKPVPKLLQYIHNEEGLDNRNEIVEGIKVLLPIGDFNTWTEYMENENKYLEECYRIGKIFLDVKEQKNAILTDEGRITKIDKYNAFIINTTENIVDLGKYVCNIKNNNNKYLIDYVFIWYYNMMDEEFRVYFISRYDSDINVLDIAKKYCYNCVGHKNLAMFRCDDIFRIIEKNLK